MTWSQSYKYVKPQIWKKIFNIAFTPEVDFMNKFGPVGHLQKKLNQGHNINEYVCWIFMTLNPRNGFIIVNYCLLFLDDNLSILQEKSPKTFWLNTDS
jgi:hypothetical protein